MPVSKSSLQAEVYNSSGEVIEHIELPRELFDQKVNSSLLTQAIQVYRANQHKGTAKTKTRGEVSGSTVKIYRQKGTGRARAGSKRAPQRMGGGIVFGPRPRDVRQYLPKKMRQAALFAALTTKWQNKAIALVSGFETLESKTKLFANALAKLPVQKQPTLLVLPAKIESVMRGMRNLDEVSVCPAALLNSYSILSAARVIFMKEAIEVLKQTWVSKKESTHAAK